MIIMESDEEAQGGSSQIFCLKWVKQHVAKSIPDKIQVSKDELEQAMNGSEDLEAEDSDDEEDVSFEARDECKPKDDGDDCDDLKEFNLESYDVDEEKQEQALSSLVVFASNDDDPYITKKDDESDESETEVEEKAALHLRQDDNMLVCGRCERDFSLLEVHVYNHKTKDFYVHHDIPLSAPPLCMEWLDFDPGSESDADKGNFIALGTMDCVIEIWDLDVINTMEPAFQLGLPSRKQKKSVPRDLYHSGAVMDIAWNPWLRDNLASSSADRTVALWSLREGRKEREFSNHAEKVQSVEWKPRDTSCLLSGACDGRIISFDVRSDATSSGAVEWKVSGEVERLAWNATETSCFAASTDSGFIYYCDVRMPGKSVHKWRAHEEAVPALRCAGNALLSASSDNSMKIWNLAQSSDLPGLVFEKDLKMGMVHCFDLNPDVRSLLAIGGEKGGVRLFDCWQQLKDSNLNVSEDQWKESTESTPDIDGGIKSRTHGSIECKNGADNTDTKNKTTTKKRTLKKKTSDRIPDQLVVAKSESAANKNCETRTVSRPGTSRTKRKRDAHARRKAARRVEKQMLLEKLDTAS